MTSSFHHHALIAIVAKTHSKSGLTSNFPTSTPAVSSRKLPRRTTVLCRLPMGKPQPDVDGKLACREYSPRRTQKAVLRHAHDEIFPDFPKVELIDQKQLIYISSLLHSQSTGRRTVSSVSASSPRRAHPRGGFHVERDASRFHPILNHAKGQSAPVDSIRQFFVDNFADTVMATARRSGVEIRDALLFFARTLTGDAERV